jgi:hypothetical protein
MVYEVKENNETSHKKRRREEENLEVRRYLKSPILASGARYPTPLAAVRFI